MVRVPVLPTAVLGLRQEQRHWKRVFRRFIVLLLQQCSSESGRVLGAPPKSYDEGPELLTGGFRATSSSAHIHKQQQQLTVLLLFSSLFEDFKTPALPSLSFQMGCEQSLILEMLRRQFFI